MKTKMMFVIYTAILASAVYSCSAGWSQSPNEYTFEAKQDDSANKVAVETVMEHMNSYAQWWFNVSSSKAAPYKTHSAHIDSSKGQASEHGNTPTCALLIPISDIENALNYNGGGYPFLRVYLGLEDSRFHLFLTPADSNKDDVKMKNAMGERYLLDLTSPCPSTCGTANELFQNFCEHLPEDRQAECGFR